MSNGKNLVNNVKILKSESLFYKDSKSDKVYNVQLIAHFGISFGSQPYRYDVRAQYGRRTATIKKEAPIKYCGRTISYAEDVYSKLITKQISKGYKRSPVIELPPDLTDSMKISPETKTKSKTVKKSGLLAFIKEGNKRPSKTWQEILNGK
jgi:hypothetical protein